MICTCWKSERFYYARLRNLAMLWLMHDFDLSARDAVSLRWQDFDLRIGRLTVRNYATGRERVFNLDSDALKVVHRWRDYQARSACYRALEFIFTTADGRQVPVLYVRFLLLGLLVYTFLPLNFLPIARPDFLK